MRRLSGRPRTQGGRAMGRRGRRATAIGATALALSAAGAGVVVAGGKSSDEAALQPVHAKAADDIETKVDKLLAQMTLQEKLDQLTLLSDGQINHTEARKPVGGVFSLVDPVKINQFQHDAV